MTVGTAAATLMGLDSAALLTGDPLVAARARPPAPGGGEAFGPTGYHRYATTAGSLVSAGRQGADANVASSCRRSQSEACRRRVGRVEASVRLCGNRPVASRRARWRNDGVSWTRDHPVPWVAARTAPATWRPIS